MPYWDLYYHFTWGTRLRQPMILDDFSIALYKALYSKAFELGGIVHAIGGVEDHIHLAVSVPPKISLSDFVGQLKGNSSHFVNHVIKPNDPFNWQNEYGVVSFGRKNLPMIVSYVNNQKQHHREKTIIDRLEMIVD